MAAVITAADADGAAAVAATRFTEHTATAVTAQGSALVVLTGGRSPARLYELLADPAAPYRSRIEWPRLYVTWTDERHVAPDHQDSNFGLADRTLLAHVPVDASHVFRMRGEIPDPHVAAELCDAELRAGLAAAERERFEPDVTLLGIGDDAHIASLFPHSPLIQPETTGTAPADARIAAAIWASHLKAWRITLTPAALLRSRAIVVLAFGTAKAEAVQAALEAPIDLRRWPAQILRSAGDRVTWILDAAAAARLRAAQRG